MYHRKTEDPPALLCSALLHPDFSLSCFPALRDFALLSHLSLSSPKASPVNEYNDNISVAWSKLNSFCSSSPDHFLPCSHSVENTSVLLSLLIDPKSKHGSPPQPPLPFSSPAMRSLQSLQRPPWFVPPLPSTFTSSVLPLVFIIWTSADKCSSY